MNLAAISKLGVANPFQQRYDNYIDGKFVAPVKDQYLGNVTPITGLVFCEIARSTAEDIELALDAAHAAKDAWGKTSPAERANLLVSYSPKALGFFSIIASGWRRQGPQFLERSCISTTIARVVVTEAALEMIAELRQRHGPLMFFQSGGCCDGSSPMCYTLGEFNLSNSDVYLGSLDGTPFYMGVERLQHWEHTQLVIDLVAGNGGMFSLDNGTGWRFLTRSRLFSDDECAVLNTQPVPP